jgi:uncharacterized damage-inducible protein DinB
MDAATLFLRETTIRFRQEYLPRIEAAVHGLGVDDIWWRPHEETTSIGVLLRHLEGNVRQWILSGLAAAPDERDRSAEFASEEHPGADALLDALRSTVDAACRFLDTMPAERLEEIVRIQGYRTSVLGAIYHVLEHFGWHAGQITWIAKLRKGTQHDVHFYDDHTLGAAHNEPDGPS